VELIGLELQPVDKAYFSDIRVTNISKSFTHKTAAETSWRRYRTKLRHCHPMYKMQETAWAAVLDPAGRAYSAPPYLLADRECAGCPLPKNPTPLSAFQALSVPAP